MLHLNYSSQECHFHVVCAMLIPDLVVVWRELLRGANVSCVFVLFHSFALLRSLQVVLLLLDPNTLLYHYLRFSPVP